MSAENRRRFERFLTCRCFAEPRYDLVTRQELGMDSRFAEVSLLACPDCGQLWLRYFYEIEAFTASGRWYLGAVTAEQAADLTVENAKATLEGLTGYYFGGSYFGGRSGKTSGPLLLDP